MAAADSERAVSTSTCAHCQREIPLPNIALHSAHCARNLQKCEHCGDVVPRKLMDEHYDENHAPVNCSLCKHTIERELWDLHTGIQCPQRMLVCQYCEFELPAVDLFEHQDVCGNRTEYCQACRKYIRLREWIGHEIQFHTNSTTELSSDRAMPEDAPAAAAEQPLPDKEEGAPAAAAEQPLPDKEEGAPAAAAEQPLPDKEEGAPAAAAEQPLPDKEEGAPAAAAEQPLPDKEEGAPAATEQPVQQPVRPTAHGSQRKQLLWTIAITGIAVLIGTMLYQKKGG